jgi:hypothetical protein
MAKKDKLNLQGSFFDTVNLHYSVGRSADNKPDDVMLIQALFQWIGFTPATAFGQLGMSIAQLPKITGVCDGVTQRAIVAFQRKNARNLLNIDGVIHPASYENRRLNRPAGSRVMAITLLGDFALDAEVGRDFKGGDFIKGLVSLEPRLKQALA